MYDNASILVRPDLGEAHERYWRRLAAPGAWWSGSERVAIAAESRQAWDCPLCQERLAALSPEWAAGEHEIHTTLPPAAIEAVHRITTDPSRLSRAWFDRLVPEHLSPGAYIELVGTVVSTMSIDSFCQALGELVHPLPTPKPGEPSQYTPHGATQTDAWAPMIPPENLAEPEAEIYGGIAIGNVIRALSLVPDEVRTLQDLSAAQYLPSHKVRDPTARGGSLLRSQTELIAGRVAAQSGCFY